MERTDENDHVEVHEIRGFHSTTITGALNEAYAVSKGTKCRNFLFSVSINPPKNEQVSIEQFEDAVNRVEKRNNLSGQPRIIVFHEKEGRRHAHAVWSKTDPETMTARNLSYYKYKLRDISRELYLEHGWKMPRGYIDTKEKDPRNFSLAEWQQAKRVGQDPRDLKVLMQDCWAVSDSLPSFQNALKERGWTLAKGDRRGHVAISPEGEVLSVARYVGKKTKDIKARLGDPKELPSVDDAKKQLAREMSETLKRHISEANEKKTKELAAFETKRQAMVAQQHQERAKLDTGQKQRWNEESLERSKRFRSGLSALWQALSGQAKVLREQNEREAYQALRRDRAQRQDLINAQLKDRQELQVERTTIRKSHAKALREIHKERQEYREMENSPEKVVQVRRPRKTTGQRRAAPRQRPPSRIDQFREVSRGQPNVQPSKPSPPRRTRDQDRGRG